MFYGLAQFRHEDVELGRLLDGELARLNALLSAGGEDAQRLSKALALVEKGAGAAPKAGKLEKAIKKKSGAFSSLVEFCVEDGTKQELEDVSRACRMASPHGQPSLYKLLAFDRVALSLSCTHAITAPSCPPCSMDFRTTKS